MAKTYKNNAISVPQIFEEIVNEVSANLSSDADLQIPYVKFRHGTWLDILNELTIDSAHPNDAIKNEKYPLVCLIHQFDEKYTSNEVDDIDVTLVIVCNSTATKTTADRYSDNFLPILYPIYQELKQVIADSYHFLGYNSKFSHSKRDLIHAGQESADGNTAYKLPDVLDGILMGNIKLKVNVTSYCINVPSPCSLTPCPKGLENGYVNIINAITILVPAGTGDLLIMISNFTYYNGAASGAPFIPTLDWGDGSPTQLILPYVSETKNFSGVPDGVYIGSVTFEGSSIQFYYHVVGGFIIENSSSIFMGIVNGLACEDYPNYPFEIQAIHNIDKNLQPNELIEEVTLNLFGNEVFNEVYSPTVGSSDVTISATGQYDINDSTIEQVINVTGGVTLTQVAQIKTQCII